MKIFKITFVSFTTANRPTQKVSVSICNCLQQKQVSVASIISNTFEKIYIRECHLAVKIFGVLICQTITSRLYNTRKIPYSVEILFNNIICSCISLHFEQVDHCMGRSLCAKKRVETILLYFKLLNTRNR